MAERPPVLVRLASESVEEIAQRLAELVRGENPSDGLIDAAEVARRLGVARSWVYDHAAELGAKRLTDGPKSRLRFDPAHIAQPAPSQGNGAPPKRTKARARKARSAGLLPVAGKRR